MLRIDNWQAAIKALHGDVVALTVGAHKVGLPCHPAGEDGPGSAGVVPDMDPVANVLAVAVELGEDAAEHVSKLNTIDTSAHPISVYDSTTSPIRS